MARKRMLSPDIWESETFSSLSDLEKIVFIGLISLSDDEGRGKANPSYIKSTLFPYDEGRRVADIKSALSKIARCMSTQFYSVNGNDYYVLTNWNKWQKIDRPTKSKLPPPPMFGVGETTSLYEENKKLDEGSTSTRRMLDEGSSPNRSRIRIEKENNISSSSIVSKEIYNELCETIGKSDCDYYIERFKAFKEKHPDANAPIKATILKWQREDKSKGVIVEKPTKTYTSEQLNAQFDNLSYEDL